MSLSIKNSSRMTNRASSIWEDFMHNIWKAITIRIPRKDSQKEQSHIPCHSQNDMQDVMNDWMRRLFMKLYNWQSFVFRLASSCPVKKSYQGSIPIFWFWTWTMKLRWYESKYETWIFNYVDIERIVISSVAQYMDKKGGVVSIKAGLSTPESIHGFTHILNLVPSGSDRCSVGKGTAFLHITPSYLIPPFLTNWSLENNQPPNNFQGENLSAELIDFCFTSTHQNWMFGSIEL